MPVWFPSGCGEISGTGQPGSILHLDVQSISGWLRTVIQRDSSSAVMSHKIPVWLDVDTGEWEQHFLDLCLLSLTKLRSRRRRHSNQISHSALLMRHFGMLGCLCHSRCWSSSAPQSAWSFEHTWQCFHNQHNDEFVEHLDCNRANRCYRISWDDASILSPRSRVPF